MTKFKENKKYEKQKLILETQMGTNSPNDNCFHIKAVLQKFKCVKNRLILIILKILSKIFYFSTMHPIEGLQPEFMNNYMWGVPIQQQSCNQMITNSCMFEIMNFQNYLNLELLKNQNLISSYINLKKDSDKCKTTASVISSTSQGFENQNMAPNFQNNQESRLFKNYARQPLSIDISFKQKPTNSGNGIHKNTKKSKSKNSDSQYEPEKSQSQNYKIGKSSESKNVPKNFSKAILLFIKRKQNLVKKIVEQQGENYEQFCKECQDMKGKINSISQLRSLWLQQQSKYAKIMRIVSSAYIRKYSLQHIFNSRIQDYGKHLKYRNKISQVLKNPSQFTRMKDY